MVNVTKEQIVQLADMHITHYQRMINSAHKNVNISECMFYKSIWEDTRLCITTGCSISEEGKGEIRDALSSGEYDDVVPNASEDFEYVLPC